MKIFLKPSSMRIMLTAASLIVGGSLLFTGAAQAQLGGLGIGKKKADGEAAAGDKESYAKSVDDLVGQVTKARATFLEAQSNLVEALGLKTDAAAKLSAAKQAIEGAATTSDKIDRIKDSSKVSTDAAKVLKEGTDKSLELSAEAKQKFGDGTAKLYEGTLSEKDQIDTIQKLVDEGKALAQSANVLERPKVLNLAKPVTSLASVVPGDVKIGVSTLASLMKFAKKQNITIPNEEKIMALLGDNP